MLKLRSNPYGFSTIEVLIVIIVVVIIGVAGFFVVTNVGKNNTTKTNNDSGAVALTITRSNPLKQPGVSQFTVKVRNEQTANTILTDLKRLQPRPSGVFGCPNDNGVNYTLHFTDPSAIYTVDASGCENVTMNNSVYTALSTNNNAGMNFWNAISKATGQPIDPVQ